MVGFTSSARVNVQHHVMIAKVINKQYSPLSSILQAPETESLRIT
jgi:hypothetical protein